MNDPVNRPEHYIPEDPAYECVLVAEAWGLDKDAYLFNTLKYMCRHGKKDPEKTIQDLEKAEFFLHRKIENLKKCKKVEEEPPEEPMEPFTSTLQNMFWAGSNGPIYKGITNAS